MVSWVGGGGGGEGLGMKLIRYNSDSTSSNKSVPLQSLTSDAAHTTALHHTMSLVLKYLKSIVLEACSISMCVCSCLWKSH